ncbi:MAG TPA: PEP-utilizing enzyme [Acidimicrobiales bacterium]|nr:PEP-utilizing enzyme [Acidimicrobiales bacterium]
MDAWITDTGPWERFPYFTRANADEVGPEPFSPLGWSLAWVKGTGPGAADGYVSFGVFRPEEMEPRLSVFANYGGYFYNALSTARILGVRMPGASPEAVDAAYFGDHPGVPPYEPDPRDEDPELSEALARRVEWLFSTDSFPELDEAVALTLRTRDARPDLSTLSDAELVAHARDLVPLIREVWRPYCMVLLGISIVSGTVAEIVKGLGRSDALIPLFSGLGGVESAGGSLGVWKLSRHVRRSAELTEAFDAGVTGVLERVRRLADGGSPEAKAFLADHDELIAEQGHRGPHEWDLRAECWATDPSLVLGMIDLVRAQGDDHDPAVLAGRSGEEREALTSSLAATLEGEPETRETLLAALRASNLLFRLREAGKSACIRLYFEVKLALRELGRRAAQSGAIDGADHVFFLLDEELDAFVGDPGSFAATLRQRVADFAVLAGLEPPYIVDSRVGPPPIGEWPRRGDAGTAGLAGAGDVLQGGPASPGRATGRARIVEDPATAEFEVGDVLVCRTTDPSWVPLFLAASAVVCNVGAFASHAAIVARELGVPCAVSVVDATARIPSGATVEVDGGTGTVTILSVG